MKISPEIRIKGASCGLVNIITTMKSDAVTVFLKVFFSKLFCMNHMDARDENAQRL